MLIGRKFAANTEGSSRRPAQGFTLLELMVVMAIILVLLGMAAGKYQRSIMHSREAVLHQDLRVMRDAIQQYSLDKQAAPQSLDDLVDRKDGNGGYLREIPIDPITQQRDWKTDTEDVLLTPEQTTVGISDVHSASNEISPFEGTPYSKW